MPAGGCEEEPVARRGRHDTNRDRDRQTDREEREREKEERKTR